MRTPTPLPDKLESEPVKRFAYSVEDAARSMGIGRTLLFELIRDNQIAVVRLGRRTIIPEAEILSFLNRVKTTR